MRISTAIRTLLGTCAALTATLSFAAPARLELAPVAREDRLTEDMLAPTGTPLRYAQLRDLRVIMQRGVSTQGTWTDAGNRDGTPMRRWSLTVRTPNAISQDFGFSHLFLPHGASLVLRAADGSVAAGPYTDTDVAAGRRFATAFVPGETAVLEISVPAPLARHVSFELDRVAPAHRAILGVEGDGFAKSGSCNVDVRCPQGNPYPDQINSVANYTFNGFVCTGALINNTGGDRAPYFLTAHHCVDSQADVETAVFYWKYENPFCREPFSGASGSSIPRSGNSIAQTGGALLRATRSDSDFTLLLLRSPPPAGANAFLAGWDRRNLAPPSAFTIHHPQGHEKRISFDNGPLQIFDQTVSFVSGNSFLRVVNWELGTTEGGSSGAPLFNPERRITGQLAGGAALCSNLNGDDYFGRLFTSFTRGTTPATRLQEWLDPGNTGAPVLDGVSVAGGCTPPAATLTAPAVARAGEPVDLVLTLPAGTYRVEWDIDGDGITDRVQAAASGTVRLQPIYPRENNQSITVRVIGAAACTTTLTRALVVEGPRVSVTAAGVPQQLCGDGDQVLDPGERWRVPVLIRNDGTKALSDGHAVFAPANAATVRLETPALAIPSLGPNGLSQVSLVDFAIPTTAACGASASIRYVGALDRTAWSTEQDSTPIGLTIGGGGACNVVQFCPAQIAPITPQVGLFVNPTRFGNGIGTFVTDNPDPDPPVLFGAWFTGTTARVPVWYTMQGGLVDNRSDVVIRQFRRTSQSPFAVAGTVIGSGQVTYIGPNDYLFTYNVNGRTGAERQTLGVTDTSVFPDRTGVWVYRPEEGSGYVIDNHRNAGSAIELLIAFIYGTDNAARWTFGSRTLGNPTGAQDYFEVHCPTCPALVDFLDTRVNAGTTTPTYSSLTTGFLSTNIRSTTPVSIDWVRSNVPIEMISTPRP